MKDDEKDIRKNVLSAITSGSVTMRPRWYFVLTAALTATGIVILGVAVLYLTSFIFFVLRETGVLFVPAFGAPGWFAFVRSAPWMLILLAVIFIVLLEILVRRFSFGYRKPLLYSIVGIVLVVIGGSLLIFSTSFHRNLFASASRNQLPIIGGFYRLFGIQHFHDIHPGVVVAVMPGSFIFQEDSRDETGTVVLLPSTQLPSGVVIVPGDRIVVFGDEASDVIEAVGIREMGE